MNEWLLYIDSPHKKYSMFPNKYRTGKKPGLRQDHRV